MKCDGPSQVPCRGCKASGQPCVFEARTRPKSISALPPRASPYYSGSLRGSTPTSSGFYPSGAQPAPPITSRPPPEPYALRQAREPMPPPPATSISSLTAPYGLSRPQSPQITTSFHPPPLQLPPLSASSGPPSANPGASVEGRLRTIESTLRSLQDIPNSLRRCIHLSSHFSDRKIIVLAVQYKYQRWFGIAFVLELGHSLHG